MAAKKTNEQIALESTGPTLGDDNTSEETQLLNGNTSDENENTQPTESESFKYGEFKFEDVPSRPSQKTHQFVKVDVGPDADDVTDELVQKLIEDLKQKWELKRPKLVISVTGGAWDFPTKTHVKEVFRKGIVEAAVSTDAMIITGGTHTGVMKYVGAAVRDYELAMNTTHSKIVTLGIATWGKLRKTHQSELDDALDTENIAKLLALKKDDDGVVLNANHTHFILVDNGKAEFGADVTLRAKLEKAIKKTKWETQEESDLPVVCIVVEGGKNTIKQTCEAVENGTPTVVIADSGRAANVLSYAFNDEGQKGPIRNDIKIEVSKKLEKIVGKDLVEKHAKPIENCWKEPHLLNVYEERSGLEIDQVILQALMKANHHPLDQLMLAQTWNRIDIVRNEIFGSMSDTIDWKTYQKNEEKLKANLRLALWKNQFGFVKLFLENDAVRLHKFLTKSELEQLYQKVTPRSRLFKSAEECLKITLEDVDEVIKELTMGTFSSTDHGDSEASLKDPFRHLFLFAVLNNFDEMARYFWEEGDEQIAAALTASKIYKSMENRESEENDERKKRLQENARVYDELAYEVLNECEKQTEGNDTFDLLIRVRRQWGNMTCLKLAESAGNRQFISHSGVQNALKKIWHKGHAVIQDQENCSQTTLEEFVRSPRGKFVNDVVCYILFLALFSYIMVSDQFSNSTPSGFEWLFIVWGFTFITEELRQLGTTKNEVRGYFINKWNWLDIAMLLLFVVGVILRFTNIGLDAARILLAFSLFCFYFRLLQKLTLFKHTGPKVLMIGQMLIDLSFFVAIIVIVMVGYGIAVQSILYPHVTDPATVLQGIVFRPYFQIYGELFLEDIQATVDAGTCTSNETAIRLGAKACPEHSGIGIFCIAVYMIFSNVLLLNLLIAMFSNTFEKVQVENDIHWKYLRYSLTNEYFNHPILSPPLNIILHIYRFARCLPNSPKMERKFSDQDESKMAKMEQRQAYDYIIGKREREQQDIRKNAMPSRLDKVEAHLKEIKSKVDSMTSGQG